MQASSVGSAPIALLQLQAAVTGWQLTSKFLSLRNDEMSRVGKRLSYHGQGIHAMVNLMHNYSISWPAMMKNSKRQEKTHHKQLKRTGLQTSGKYEI